MKEPTLPTLIIQNDWRLQGQDWLREELLRYAHYSPRRQGSEHDHCEFCSAKFTETESADAEGEGYATADNYHWVCKKCFSDFKVRFGWPDGSS